jgi:hypothetical protein
VRVAGVWIIVATISPPAPPPAVASDDTVEINSTSDQEVVSAPVGTLATNDRIRLWVSMDSEEEAGSGTGMVWSVYFGTTLLATGAMNITSAGEITYTDDPIALSQQLFAAAHGGDDSIRLYLRKTNGGHPDRNVAGHVVVEVLRTDYSVLLP